MKRRRFLLTLAATAYGPAVPAQAKASARVLVVGGGYAGATAAKYLRLWSGGTVAVTLAEPNAYYVSCPMSNLVLGGFRRMADITLDYQALQQRYGARLFAYCLLQLAAFALTWKHSRLADQFPVVPWIYFWGFCLFSLAFLLRERFRPNKLMDSLADVSYPLYVIHALIGYVCIRILLDRGLGFNLAVLLSFVLISSLAYGLHRWMELPSTALGKRLADLPQGIGKRTQRA